MVEYNGDHVSIKKLSRMFGINYTTLRHRILKKGMNAYDAISIPIKKQNCIVSGSKICTVCGENKEISFFNRLKRRNGNEISPMCKQCNNIICRKNRLALRIEILSRFSCGTIKCQFCDESRIEVLDLDHINGGGGKHRKQFKTNDAMYRSIRDNKENNSYRVLCRNCNWIEHLKLHKQGNYHE